VSSAEEQSFPLTDLPSEPSAPEESDESLLERDESLLERVGQGRSTALRLLMDRHWSTLVGYATGITNDRDVAQDVVLETFLQVWTKRSDWQPTGSPNAYLHRITRNLALNAYRDGTLRRKRHQEVGGAPSSVHSPRTPEEEIEARALRTEIETAISGLPERRREIFLLSRFSGLTHREIAETLGVSAQTVSNQMSAALAQLRVALARHLQD
jgi:RNA polymerase sigma-70 factor (ECF subfamily)